jgi:hypothetical protein
MSTQRRQDLCTPATKTRRRGPRGKHIRGCTERVEGLGQIWLAFLAWIARAIARVGTAPLEKVNLIFPTRLATNSLQLDYRTIQFVRFVRLAREGIRLGSHSSPSPIAGDLKNTGIPATPRSSFPHIPAPSGFSRLSPALP